MVLRWVRNSGRAWLDEFSVPHSECQLQPSTQLPHSAGNWAQMKGPRCLHSPALVLLLHGLPPQSASFLPHGLWKLDFPHSGWLL